MATTLLCACSAPDMLDVQYHACEGHSIAVVVMRDRRTPNNREERWLLPHLLRAGSLCAINHSFIELHTSGPEAEPLLIGHARFNLRSPCMTHVASR